MNISENFELYFKEEEQQELFQQLDNESKAFYVHLLCCRDNKEADINSIHLFKDGESIRAEIDTYSKLDLEMIITTNETLSESAFWEMVDMIDTDEETLLWYNREGRPDCYGLRELLDDMEEWASSMIRAHHTFDENVETYIQWLKDNNYIQ